MLYYNIVDLTLVASAHFRYYKQQRILEPQNFSDTAQHMNPLKNVIALALALLLTQTAVAVHDIHCLDGEHDQTCEIYFAQDHSADSDAVKNKLECTAYGEKPASFIDPASPTLSVFPYLSRAPPQTL